MSILRKISGFVMGFFRKLYRFGRWYVVTAAHILMLVLVLRGILLLLSGSVGRAIIELFLPTIWIGNHIWRGYRKTPAQPGKKITE
jgi:hypothetical protein